MVKKSNVQKSGFWGMLRDVLIASMNKGQFPIALITLIFMALIAKMPSEDVSKLVFKILDTAERGYLAGYAISVMLLLGWSLHAKYQRRQITHELERLSAQRNHLQSRTLGSKVKSSEVHK